MENQNLTFAGATSATAEPVAALLHGGPALGAGLAPTGGLAATGLALAGRPCPVPVALRPVGAHVRPTAVAPIRGRFSSAALSSVAPSSTALSSTAQFGTALRQAWTPPIAGVDQAQATTVFSKYTHMSDKHDPGETAPRPPV